MTDLTQPLTDQELDRLEKLLLERVAENAVTEDSDEGVLGTSELDGFFTAVVGAPEVVVPSQWLPAVWGDFEPTWRTPDELEAVVSLLVRHMNEVATHLTEHPDDFEPMYLVDDKGTVIVDDWCEGYMRAVALRTDDWDAAPPEIVDLLTPILAFTSDTGWLAHDIADPKEVDRVRDAIAPNVRAIHAYWLRLRGGDVPSVAPFRRDTPRVGRNAPCPCGSGRKYKNCCLQ